jgi:hypothetical protein
MGQQQTTQASTPKAANLGATKRVAKQKTRTKRKKRRRRKRRRTIVPTARNSIDAAHTPTYRKKNASGTKSTKAIAPGLYVTNWRLNSNPKANSQPN